MSFLVEPKLLKLSRKNSLAYSSLYSNLSRLYYLYLNLEPNITHTISSPLIIRIRISPSNIHTFKKKYENLSIFIVTIKIYKNSLLIICSTEIKPLQYDQIFESHISLQPNAVNSGGHKGGYWGYLPPPRILGVNTPPRILGVNAPPRILGVNTLP